MAILYSQQFSSVIGIFNSEKVGKTVRQVRAQRSKIKGLV